MTSFIPSARIAVAFAAGLSLAGAAFAFDFPARKPGLWEMSMNLGATASKLPVQVTQQCLDAASDKAMREMGEGMSKDRCSKQDMRNEGGKIIVDTVCKMEGPSNTVATTHSVMSGDFNSTYHVESKSSYSPPMMGRAEGSIVIDAKWVGPCKPGQKPGDMIMSNGMKMNLLDKMGGKK
ncbi:hypothetical protein SRS16CHR_00400 [Variovorax sp. SRS16]|uniref:DUF3617 domain-containing protein n=1 Tax=Variovorax sp. SRS16 TaxID=282217 RepID=UPI0013165798|nr:DUF3617 family protein [Variovorax sp. SRS16]VTU13161.1 hypothetical protein SRS16CHR_00400 [Variovorax sp. SRS16]